MKHPSYQQSKVKDRYACLSVEFERSCKKSFNDGDFKEDQNGCNKDNVSMEFDGQQPKKQSQDEELFSSSLH